MLTGQLISVTYARATFLIVFDNVVTVAMLRARSSYKKNSPKSPRILKATIPAWKSGPVESGWVISSSAW